MKIARPELDVTLLEATGKKMRFLESMVAELGLDRRAGAQGARRGAGRDPDHRERYPLVSRAGGCSAAGAARAGAAVGSASAACSPRRRAAPHHVRSASRQIALTMLGGEIISPERLTLARRRRRRQRSFWFGKLLLRRNATQGGPEFPTNVPFSSLDHAGYGRIQFAARTTMQRRVRAQPRSGSYATPGRLARAALPSRLHCFRRHPPANRRQRPAPSSSFSAPASWPASAPGSGRSRRTSRGSALAQSS